MDLTPLFMFPEKVNSTMGYLLNLLHSYWMNDLINKWEEKKQAMLTTFSPCHPLIFYTHSNLKFFIISYFYFLLFWQEIRTFEELVFLAASLLWDFLATSFTLQMIFLLGGGHFSRMGCVAIQRKIAINRPKNIYIHWKKD